MAFWIVSPLFRDHFVYAPSQWEATLQCNVVSYWLGAYPCSCLVLWKTRTPLQSISWLLITWRHKDPGHQHARHWPSLPGIFRFQHQRRQIISIFVIDFIFNPYNPCHQSGDWSKNVILTKFSSLAALEVVILTTSSAASDGNFIKMKTFPFPWVVDQGPSKGLIILWPSNHYKICCFRSLLLVLRWQVCS